MEIDWFPLWLSLRVAVISTVLAFAGGLWIAYLLANRRFRGKDVLDAAVTLPLLVKSARAALESVDRSYERAARNLGASEWKLFWRVTLPLAWRSIFAATALAFARALGDFGVTLMVAGNIPGRTQTVAVAIYEAVESGDGAVARTLVLVVSVVALVLLTLANRLSPSRV